MRRLKRFTALFLVLLLVFSFSSCKTNGQTDTSSTVDVDTPSKAEESQHSNVSKEKAIIASGDFWIIFIDVGHGDAALVYCDRHYMMIDVGPNEKDATERVKKILKDNGVNKLDYLFISHMHDDHYGGLKPLDDGKLKALDGIKVDRVFSVEKNDKNLNSEKYNLVIEELSKLDMAPKKIDVPKTSHKYSLGEAEVEIISVGGENKDANNSLVILVTYKETRFLFTGDMPAAQGEDVIKKLEKKPRITLLKVAHHGALDENKDLIEKLKPQYAVISTKKEKKEDNNHPNIKLIELLNELPKPRNVYRNVYRTDEDGSILVVSNGKSVKITTHPSTQS